MLAAHSHRATREFNGPAPPRRSKLACLIGLVTVLSCLLGTSPLLGLEKITALLDGRQQEFTGRVLVEAADGGLLIETRDGQMWPIQPDELVQRQQTDEPFEPLRGKQLVDKLRLELPDGFEVHQTAHYVLCHNTTKVYAQWCGALYERLYSGFFNYWRRRGVRLQDPAYPLVALVYNDQSTYARYARGELGDAAQSIVGYYSLRTNRILTYDLTGVDKLRQTGSRPNSANLINRVLSRPQAAPLVATLIHEATHQLAYNSGLQTRNVDNPVWLSEGLAMYFESPDLKSAKGWRTIGKVHAGRLTQFRGYLPSRPAASLTTLLGQDQRMRQPGAAVDAYAEAWALCYFLLRVHPQQFTAYLRDLADRPLLVYDSPADRIQEFESHFGNLTELEGEFLRFISRLK